MVLLAAGQVVHCAREWLIWAPGPDGLLAVRDGPLRGMAPASHRLRQRLRRLRRLRAVDGLCGGGLAGGAAGLAGRVVLLIAVAGVAAMSALAGCGVQRLHAGGRPPASAGLPRGWKPVGYAGAEVDIPASWPVVNLDTDHTACFNWDGPALYLG